jgi:acyl-CoA-binding protein
MTLEIRFKRAVEHVRSTPKDAPEAPSEFEKLEFYKYHQQAVFGPCKRNRPTPPPFWNYIDRSKWEAWHQLGDLEQQEAMRRYIELVVRFLRRFQDRPEAQRIADELEHDHLESNILAGTQTDVDVKFRVRGESLDSDVEGTIKNH